MTPNGTDLLLLLKSNGQILAPTNLLAVHSDYKSVHLTWEDNAIGEDGFSIERSLDGIDYTEIDTVDPDIASYDDTPLNVGTYYYRVRAWKGITYTEYSNVSSVTITYIANSLFVDPSSYLCYLPLDELTGSVADDTYDGANGTIIGVDLNYADGPKGERVGFWDGVNDRVQVLNTPLNSTDFSVGSVNVWVKMLVPTGTIRHYFFYFARNATNSFHISKSNNSYTILGRVYIGGTLRTITGSVTDTDWHMYTLVWDSYEGYLRMYIDAVLTGEDDTLTGIWDMAALNPTNIGCQTSTPLYVHNGHICHFQIRDAPLSLPDIQKLYDGGPI